MATDTTLDGWKPASRIAGNTRANLTQTWMFTLLWNLVSAPILAYIPSEIDRNPLAAIGLLFPIAGGGLLVWAVMMTLRWRRFGQTWFDMTTTPATPGSRLTGTIHVRLAPPRGATPLGVLMKLTCLRRTISRKSQDNDSRESIVWREEDEVPGELIAFRGEGAAIPVRFAIPADALVTTAVGGSSGVFWVLSAEARVAGVNLKEDFDVPVVEAESAPAEPQPAFDGAITSPASRAVSIESLARSGITMQPTEAGTAYRFGAMRNVSFAAGTTIFLAIWTGALWLQWTLGFPWIFPVLTGLFELLLIVIAVDLWLGVTTVTIGSGVVRRRHTILGLGSTREIPAADIAQIDLPITMQTTGRAGTPYYELRAKRTNGRKLSLGSGIRDKRQAEWLAAEMRAAIGLRVPQ